MSLYAGIPLTTLRLWLTEALTAYHQLQTGQKTVLVQLGDKQVRYGNAPDQVAQLRIHIRDLNTAIAIATGNTGSGRPAVATWNRSSGE